MLDALAPLVGSVVGGVFGGPLGVTVGATAAPQIVDNVIDSTEHIENAVKEFGEGDIDDGVSELINGALSSAFSLVTMPF